MTLGEAAGLALKVHGAVWLAAAAAYYKYGDRTDLFEKALQGNRSVRQAIRDNIATDLSKQLQQVVRAATRARSPVLDAAGGYIEHATDITESEPFYQAIRDYVSISVGALVDYRRILETTDRWRTWAHRLSRCILVLLVLQILVMTGAVLVLIFADLTRTAAPWWFVGSLVPTAVAVVLLFSCLCVVHVKHGVIVDLRERYDPKA
jgi:hypothetical protein